MEEINGTVERITYFNPENGYSVLRLRPELKRQRKLPGLNLEGLLTVVGNLPQLSPGERVKLEGDFETHAKHGLQFKAFRCQQLEPVTVKGIERYLGSGLIKGIGPELAKRIVETFNAKTLEIIENSPDKLRDVPGIGPERTEKILEAWKEQQHVKEIMLFLHDHEISTHLAVKIHRTYGDEAMIVLQRNPYQLEADINGVGFKTADQIAQSLGLPEDHPSRIEAGIIYVLNEMINHGHVYAPLEVLIQRTISLLNVDPELVPPALDRLAGTKRIICERMPSALGDPENTATQDVVYLTPFYVAEIGIARKLQSLIKQKDFASQEPLLFPQEEELSPEQEVALRTAIHSPISVITGGPGTGKTTCLKALIRVLEDRDMRYALASPTGRAAKRLAEATERPASTIHRLLGYSPALGFNYHEKKHLKAKFLVVDEASMLDLILCHHLFKALQKDAQVLLVGDVDQLPSVGAGDILRDIIDSNIVPVIRLVKIYRQAANSEIVANAHRINQGQFPVFSKDKQGDFFLFPAEKAEEAAEWVVNLVAHRIPEQFGLDPIRDIQVLTPMYRGKAGVDSLNEGLQAALNPKKPGKIEQRLYGRTFRVGDKVMQTRNNYDKDVYNGDIGLIETLNRIDQTATICFDDQRRVMFDFTEMDELVHAYAVSVHKSQGSEFPAVVMPVLTQHYVMLQRNLVYTGITRAKRLCVLVGNSKAIRIAINNNQISKRYSGLTWRLQNNMSRMEKDKRQFSYR